MLNLARFWGFKKVEREMGRDAVLHSDARRLTFKGAVQILTEEVREREKEEEERPKRKVVPVDLDESIVDGEEGSKKNRKRRRMKRKGK